MAFDIIEPSPLEIIKCSHAKAKGSRRYFTGKPCRLGHIAERRVSDHHCVMCPMPVGRQNKPTWDTLPQRFWSKVDKAPGYGPKGDCWRWTGGKRGAYGGIGTPDGTQSAHRIVYVLEVGPIPDGMDILHSCDMKLCVNPAHLAPGTHQENMAQVDRRGQIQKKYGEDAVQVSVIIPRACVAELKKIAAHMRRMHKPIAAD